MKQQPFTVGLTGGIGSGKTAASDWFAAQGIDVIDADIAARAVVMPGSAILAHIADVFGPALMLSDGSLDRAALRRIVFSNAQARQQLETITHPAIHAHILQQITQSTSAYCVLVSPLLLEGNQQQLAHRILVIDIPEPLQIARASKRDGNTPEQITSIMAAQLPRQKRLARADDIVDNSGDLKQLHDALVSLHPRYLAFAQIQKENRI